MIKWGTILIMWTVIDCIDFCFCFKHKIKNFHELFLKTVNFDYKSSRFFFILFLQKKNISLADHCKKNTSFNSSTDYDIFLI